MFAFRNRLSPTLSQLLRFNRSPVTITILGTPLNAASPGQGRATARAVIDLMRDVIGQLDHAESRMASEEWAARRRPRSIMTGHAAAFALGVAGALLAARLLGPKPAPRLAQD